MRVCVCVCVHHVGVDNPVVFNLRGRIAVVSLAGGGDTFAFRSRMAILWLPFGGRAVVARLAGGGR